MKLNLENNNEALLTCSRGYTYKSHEFAPSWALPQLMDFLKDHELTEEMDFEEQLQIALLLDDEHRFSEITPEILADTIERHRETFWGDFESVGAFAEHYFDEIGETVSPNIVVNWDATYNYALQYDFMNRFVYAKSESGIMPIIARYFWCTNY